MTDAPTDEEKRAAASLATRKFDWLEALNADPLCRRHPLTLKVGLAYVRFCNDLESAVYRSILDLRVDTGGLGAPAIITAQARLVECGYLERDGKTANGVQRFKLTFKRENIVNDHTLIARCALRERDVERKERQRQKRLAVTSLNEITDDGVTKPDEITEPLVISRDERTDAVCDFAERRPVISPDESNYLENNLEGSLHEERKEEGLALPPQGEAWPIPSSDQDAERTIEMIVDRFGDPGPARAYFRKQLCSGRLTPAEVTSFISMRRNAEMFQ